MLEKLLDNEVAINAVLISKKVTLLTFSEWDDIRCIARFLEFFKVATVEMSSSRKATLSRVIPLIAKYLIHIRALHSDA
jgi:hypothetical protein